MESFQNLEGKLLIAMPSIGDERFEDTVIYLCSHSPEGAMGLIVNKHQEALSVAELLDHLSLEPTVALDDMHVFSGGPVEHGRGFVLHSSDYETDGATLAVENGLSLTASLEVIEDIISGHGPEDSLMALGYSGWGPGQLEQELQSNGWLIGEPDREIVFKLPNDAKYEAALSKLGVDPRLLSSEGGNA